MAEGMETNTDDARVLPWDQAARVLMDEVSRLAHPYPVIGITGPVGSGKSTLAARVGGCVLSTDDYLPEYHLLPEHERDEPRHADLARLAVDLRTLRAGRPAEIPVWSFQTHRRVGARLVRPEAPIVCEGIHALDKRVLPALDIRVYVDADADERWRRWEELERSGQRGWGADHARRFFQNVAEPTFSRFAPAYRAAADFIVRNDRRDPEAGHDTEPREAQP